MHERETSRSEEVRIVFDDWLREGAVWFTCLDGLSAAMECTDAGDCEYEME
jgi:hypothetical protein